VQVNPLAPFFVNRSGVPLLEQAFFLIKHQLVGFCRGISHLGDGRLARPFGIRAVDLATQEYEGTVTIFPAWDVAEMAQFLANFDETRAEQYFMDGERATWIHLPVIRSLCEVEFTLDAVAAELQRNGLRGRAPSGSAALPSSPSRDASTGSGRGKLPSYLSLSAYGNVSAAPSSDAGGDYSDPPSRRGMGGGLRVASCASMLNLSSMGMPVEGTDGPPSMGHTPSVGLAPMPMS